ncbi:MAG: response regulator [Planctomycetes bacterium]|nr:response regulator [Planctomycetota bacterium]
MAIVNSNPIPRIEHAWLFVGDLGSDEFAALRADLSRLPTQRAVANLASGVADIDDGFSPTWIVLVEALPRALRRDELARLTERWPLARVLRVAGSWCESERRHGWDWPGAWRILWHQWPSWLAQTQSQAERGEMPARQATTSDEESWLVDAPPATNRAASGTNPRPRALVVGDDAEQAAWLVKACVRLGFDVQHRRSTEAAEESNCAAVVYDVAFPQSTSMEQIAVCRQSHPAGAFVVLCGFPRTDDVARWQAAGATAVLAKPVRLADLDCALMQKLAQQSVLPGV